MMIIFYMKPNEHHRNKFHKYYDAPYGMMHEVGGNLKKKYLARNFFKDLPSYFLLEG